ncbi:hypothetical protein EPN90_01265 [Patescibacteria group bacterium]|nr:MAG: hypothetical protein EPN90_01265 [Patescibacteria group bacterium]
MTGEPTLLDILEAIHDFATYVEKRFNGIDQRFVGIDQRFESIDKRFESIDRHFEMIEAQMVTKEYLSDKLSDLRGELVLLTRKEDKKLCAVIDELEKKRVFSWKTARNIRSLEPFAQFTAPSNSN